MTGRLQAAWRSAIAVTIWRPGLFGLPPDRYANLYRVVLPLFDLALLVAGVGAIVYGSPAFTDFSDGLRIFGLGWGVWLTVFSTLALAGIAFPKLLPLEGIGKAGVVAAVLVYMLILILLTGGGSTTRFVASGISAAALLLAAWRLRDLRHERLKRQSEASAEHRHAAAEGTP